jgi:adenylylsulfate kinase
MTKANHRGFTIWFTGPPGAGKTTLSKGLEALLQRRGLPVEVLDGDRVRQDLSRDLGYSREDRLENMVRIGSACRKICEGGRVAIAATISPYQQGREEARKGHPQGRFIEVFLDCPLERLIQRDSKGLYQKALRGEIERFTGISDPYEPPAAPELIIPTDRLTVEEGLRLIISWLEENGFLLSGTSRSERGLDKEQGKPQP